MSEEVFVFCCHERINHMLRDRLIRHEHAVLACKFGDQRAVAAVNTRSDRRFVLLQLGNRRHIAAQRSEVDPNHNDADNPQHQAQNDQPAQPFPQAIVFARFPVGIRLPRGLEGRGGICHLQTLRRIVDLRPQSTLRANEVARISGYTKARRWRAKGAAVRCPAG